MRQRLIYLMKVFMLTVVIFIAAKLVFMLAMRAMTLVSATWWL